MLRIRHPITSALSPAFVHGSTWNGGSARCGDRTQVVRVDRRRTTRCARPAAMFGADAGTRVAFSEVMTNSTARSSSPTISATVDAPPCTGRSPSPTRAPFHVLHFVCAIEPHAPTRDQGEPRRRLRVRRPRAASVDDEVESELRGAGVTGTVHFYVHARIGKPAERGPPARTRGRRGLIDHRQQGAHRRRPAHARLGLGEGGARSALHGRGGSPQDPTTTSSCPRSWTRPRRITRYLPPHRYSYEDRRLDVRPGRLAAVLKGRPRETRNPCGGFRRSCRPCARTGGSQGFGWRRTSRP